MADGPAGVRINRGDVHEGRATALPAPIALAATWTPELAAAYGDVLGAEAFASGHNVQLGPAVDIARVPTGGRTFESFGEDPLLASEIGVGVIRGIQTHPVQACVKHFAANNQEDSRATIDVRVDERTLMELYLPPFEAAVRQGGVASVMAAFNQVNGSYACQSQDLLTSILRDRFGFRGWVMSDYGANHATAESANAGLDQEQPTAGHWGEQLLAAVRGGQVAEETLDEMVRRILRPQVGLGQMERRPAIAALDLDAHAELAQRVAEQSMVLLGNSSGLLPLRAGELSSLAVIGPEAGSAAAAGGGSSRVRPAG
jgi:beta-glucosidase